MRSWEPSLWARLFGRADRWQLSTQLPWFLQLQQGGLDTPVSVDALRSMTVQQGFFWATVQFVTPAGSIILPGVSRGTLADMRVTFAASLAEFDRLRELAALFDQDSKTIHSWWCGVTAEWEQLSRRWIPREVVESWQAARPSIDTAFLSAYQEPGLADFLAQHPKSRHEAIRAWQHADLEAAAAERNELFLAQEKVELADFFGTIEKSPLTDDQVEAVARFDNRVRVIAAAGSGKTSTMVARTAYTLLRQIAQPHQILMLAFNRKAAAELQERVEKRVGDNSKGVTAKTFHSFGLSVIGDATGKKPRLAARVLEDNGIGRLQRVVDQLSDENPQWRRTWDLFRLVYADALPEFGEKERPEDWDWQTKTSGFLTLNGEVVRSKEERLIANWLFYNGVRYEYERPYAHDTADAEHGQYLPDFYYPDIDVYHEHFALDSRGNPPPAFTGYADGVRWKRTLHLNHGTSLLETTSAGVRNGSSFEYLAAELTRRGVVFDPNPFRESPRGAEPLDDYKLTNFVRTFLVHAKGNRLNTSTIAERAARRSDTSMRTRLFLYLFEGLYAGWQHSLFSEQAIDFEDMINQATDLIEEGHWSSPYTVVMVDEMQDTSNSRARFVQALTAKPGIFLYAVGDDWQSIYRFAGADLSVMTGFERWFGKGPTVRLERTFRSSQSICDVAGTFVMKNPTQIAKTVQSTQPEYAPTLQAIAVPAKDDYASAIDEYLTGLENTLPERDEKVSVYVLGRYRRDSETITKVKVKPWQKLTVEFNTIHESKGKEADYIIIPGLTRRSFPSEIQDDPLLRLVMPNEDIFPQGEERRLFYVALTRARRAVLMLTVTGRESSFLLELVNDHGLTVESMGGTDLTPIICTSCKVNRMVLRTSKYGEFYGCSAYPSCTGKRKLANVKK